MGCDIYPYVEYRKDGKWITADWWVTREEGDPEIPYHAGIPRGRDYCWFAFLADVRNETWGNRMPIFEEPRGIPEDACAEVQAASSRWDGDGHSHSWITFKELERAWEQVKGIKVKFSGAVDTSDPSPELQAWLDGPRQTAPPGGFCASGYSHGAPLPKVEWTQTVEEIIGDAYQGWWNYLLRVAIEYGVLNEKSNVRVVFWFDN